MEIFGESGILREAERIDKGRERWREGKGERERERDGMNEKD